MDPGVIGKIKYHFGQLHVAFLEPGALKRVATESKQQSRRFCRGGAIVHAPSHSQGRPVVHAAQEEKYGWAGRSRTSILAVGDLA
tara:strand:- start:104 stop:358 length:255 start_codon:yes stop_codon:yes gene_type:complete